MRMKTHGGVKYGQYPYTVTRVKVMRSSLLTPQDYLKMHNMGFNEIARMLEEGEYREDINKYSGKHSGIELIEVAIKENFARTIQKLLFISTREVRELIQTYSLKWLLHNFKLIMKVKMGILDSDEMTILQIPLKPTTYSFSRELLREEMEEIIKRIASRVPIDQKELLDYVEQKDVIGLENAIDRAYYKNLQALVKRMALGRKDPLKRLLSDVIALTNIKTIIRLKSKKVNQEKIKAALIPMPGRSLIKKLVEADNLHATLEILRESSFAVLGDARVEEDIALLENLSEQYLFRYAFILLHRSPLSVSSVFGFMLLKEIEVRNLRIFIHAKTLGLDKEFIDSTIVVN